jgi:lysyl-tRNA synthetase, class II
VSDTELSQVWICADAATDVIALTPAQPTAALPSGPVVTRRLTAPALLALGASLAGVIGIVSALTPEFANRFDLVKGVLPPGVPEAARALALAFGIVLIWTSRGLARRRRRAWKLAVGLVLASCAAHLAKGLDFEEAIATLVLLVALWRWRADFWVRGDPATRWPLAQAIAGLLAVGGLIWLRVTDHVSYSERIEEALVVIASVLALRALYLWFRPHVHRGKQSELERRAAEGIVHVQGRDSLCYFALRRDKSWFFSPSGRSFLAFKVVGGVALVSGEPIGEPDELPGLLHDFTREAHARGWRVAVIGVAEDSLPFYRGLGLRSFYIGDEAVVRPESFSLEGRAIRKVRQSVTRLHKSGYTARVLRPDEVDPELRYQIEEVSTAWRCGTRERGFSMAMDALFRYPDSRIVVAEDADGRVGGFIQLVPVPATNGYSLASMRRRLDTPNGLMEFLIVEALEWGRMSGISELSLNFSMFGSVLRREGGLLRWALLRADRFFQIERLHSFNAKFFPEWRPRHLCFESYLDLPLVALVYGHLEGFVVAPGPWTRTPDLAAA